MRPKSDIWRVGGLKQFGVDRRAEFAALWVLLIHIVSVYVCVCAGQRWGASTLLISGWSSCTPAGPEAPCAASSELFNIHSRSTFFNPVFCSSFLLTVSVCLHSKRHTHIIKGINVQNHLVLSWCTALGHGTALFVSKSLHQSVFGLEHNDWFYKGSNQMVKSGANNTLETLWLH